MTLRRLNLKIQGLPESYATEPYMGDMVIGEPHPLASSMPPDPVVALPSLLEQRPGLPPHQSHPPSSHPPLHGGEVATPSVPLPPSRNDDNNDDNNGSPLEEPLHSSSHLPPMEALHAGSASGTANPGSRGGGGGGSDGGGPSRPTGTDGPEVDEASSTTPTLTATGEDSGEVPPDNDDEEEDDEDAVGEEKKLPDPDTRGNTSNAAATADRVKEMAVV